MRIRRSSGLTSRSGAREALTQSLAQVPVSLSSRLGFLAPSAWPGFTRIPRRPLPFQELRWPYPCRHGGRLPPIRLPFPVPLVPRPLQISRSPRSPGMVLSGPRPDPPRLRLHAFSRTTARLPSPPLAHRNTAITFSLTAPDLASSPDSIPRLAVLARRLLRTAARASAYALCSA